MAETMSIAEAEAEEYLKQLVGSVPVADEKQNVHTFLRDVVTARDTTKLGNLKEEEVGLPKLPLRTYHELALFCNEISNMNYFSEYFKKKGEILTSTSLSKDAKLIDLAVIQRREIAQRLKQKVPKKSWFTKKEATATKEL